MDKSAKVFSSEYTVPTKKPKEPIAYPKLEEEKAIIKKIKYLQSSISHLDISAGLANKVSNFVIFLAFIIFSIIIKSVFSSL